MINAIFTLLVIYQLKHLLADFPLQTPYMLKKFLPGWDFFLPLLSHTAVHGLFTLMIALYFKPELAVQLALTDMTLHFFMDRIKASPKYLGRYKALSASEYPTVAAMAKGSMPDGMQLRKGEVQDKVSWAKDRLKSNVYFWWSLGIDQGFHHLTHYYLIWRMIS